MTPPDGAPDGFAGQRLDALCLGNFVVDLIARPLEQLPARGQLQLLDTLEAHVGGNGPNCAIALARLGAATGACGRVGDDLFGRFLTGRLEGEGVDCRWVSQDAQAGTGVTIVAVDSAGERSFIYQPGANGSLAGGVIPEEALRGTRLLHAGSHFVLPSLAGEGMADLLRRARAAGAEVSLDVCWDASGRWMSVLRPCLEDLDYFLPSEDEAAALSGETTPEAMARVFHDLGARCVVIKRGENGCFVSAGAESWHEPAFEVEAVDSTGAGDCFIAGFISRVLEGQGLRQAARFGCACGALAVQSIGATTGLGSTTSVEEWMASRPRRTVL